MIIASENGVSFIAAKDPVLQTFAQSPSVLFISFVSLLSVTLKVAQAFPRSITGFSILLIGDISVSPLGPFTKLPCEM